MASEIDGIRRVVTTHDAHGVAVVLSDGPVAMRELMGPDIQGAAVWTTAAVPADNVADVEGDHREVGPTLQGGSVLRVTEFGPGFASPMHRTHSIDYAAVLSGELDLELDSGTIVRLHAGDVVVQRGTNHVWRNPSPDWPCRILIAMIEAMPVTLGGETLEATL